MHVCILTPAVAKRACTYKGVPKWSFRGVPLNEGDVHMVILVITRYAYMCAVSAKQGIHISVLCVQPPKTRVYGSTPNSNIPKYHPVAHMH